MTRKLIFTIAVLFALFSFTVPPAHTQTKGASCENIKVICRQEADAWYFGCIASSGPLGFLWCYPASEDKNQLCVKEKSDGQCSVFH